MTNDARSEETSIWVDSLGLLLQEALDLMGAAVRDCTDELWTRNMWEVPRPDPDAEIRGLGGGLVSDPVERQALVQRHGAPWGVAWHALSILDARLFQGGLVPWATYPDLGAAPDFDITTLAAAWSRADLLGYTDYCRQRVAEALRKLTHQKAAARLPSGRNQGKPYAWRLMSMAGHVTEHGSQIRQFITAAGITSDSEAV